MNYTNYTNHTNHITKILLITPPYHCGVVESAGRWPNLGFIYMAGELRKAGFTPVIYDAMTLNHDLDDIEKRIGKEDPDVVAATACTPTYPAAIEVLKLAKRLNPDVVTVIEEFRGRWCREEEFRGRWCREGGI